MRVKVTLCCALAVAALALSATPHAVAAPTAAAPAVEAANLWKSLGERAPGLHIEGDWLFVRVVLDASGSNAQRLRLEAQRRTGELLWEEALRRRGVSVEDLALLHDAGANGLRLSGHVLQQRRSGDRFEYVLALRLSVFEAALANLRVDDAIQKALAKVRANPDRYAHWFKSMGAPELALLADLRNMREPIWSVGVPPVSMRIWAVKAEQYFSLRDRLLSSLEATTASGPLLSAAVRCTDDPKGFAKQLQAEGVAPGALRTALPYGVAAAVSVCQGFARLDPDFAKAPAYVPVAGERPDPAVLVERTPAKSSAWRAWCAERLHAQDADGLLAAARMSYLTASTPEELQTAFSLLLDLERSPGVARVAKALARVSS